MPTAPGQCRPPGVPRPRVASVRAMDSSTVGSQRCVAGSVTLVADGPCRQDAKWQMSPAQLCAAPGTVCRVTSTTTGCDSFSCGFWSRRLLMSYECYTTLLALRPDQHPTIYISSWIQRRRQRNDEEKAAELVRNAKIFLHFKCIILLWYEVKASLTIALITFR